MGRLRSSFSKHCAGAALSVLRPSRGPENHCEGRQNDTKRQHQERDLQPYQAADLTKDKFYSRSPRRWNVVAYELNAALDKPLCARKQFRALVEGQSQKDHARIAVTVRKEWTLRW
jgi:hypothetical protein